MVNDNDSVFTQSDAYYDFMRPYAARLLAYVKQHQNDSRITAPPYNIASIDDRLMLSVWHALAYLVGEIEDRSSGRQISYIRNIPAAITFLEFMVNEGTKLRGD